MSNMIVRVELMPGTNIHEAIKEARNKCIMWDVTWVVFKFNGVEVHINRDADIDATYEVYSDSVFTKNTSIFSVSK